MMMVRLSFSRRTQESWYSTFDKVCNRGAQISLSNSDFFFLSVRTTIDGIQKHCYDHNESSDIKILHQNDLKACLVINSSNVPVCAVSVVWIGRKQTRRERHKKACETMPCVSEQQRFPCLKPTYSCPDRLISASLV